ncbi:carbon storage regulator CsrA [Aporhodopirellula aestuarii]|uniref:Translational regulator CsrA n=1 Tax=Aporhodopirellula aestuarii TaxID=2950107 RepID=A0ABT0U4D7_9BACT|nr:carbon storage regulator CsrA [Aporhodopirellula aestuarii]
MLVLTRKLNEQIKIGNDITITVIKLRNNQIRLGIEAPRDVRVLRAELGDAVADAVEAEAKSSDSTKTASPSSNRVRTYLNVSEVAEVADEPTNAVVDQPIRNEVVDGLMSADEMIAAGKDSDDEKFDDGTTAGNDSPQASIQLFSGRIDCNGTVRENVARELSATRNRAPLSAFFTAP